MEVTAYTIHIEEGNLCIRAQFEIPIQGGSETLIESFKGKTEVQTFIGTLEMLHQQLGRLLEGNLSTEVE